MALPLSVVWEALRSCLPWGCEHSLFYAAGLKCLLLFLMLGSPLPRSTHNVLSFFFLILDAGDSDFLLGAQYSPDSPMRPQLLSQRRKRNGSSHSVTSSKQNVCVLRHWGNSDITRFLPVVTCSSP